MNRIIEEILERLTDAQNLLNHAKWQLDHLPVLVKDLKINLEAVK